RRTAILLAPIPAIAGIPRQYLRRGHGFGQGSIHHGDGSCWRCLASDDGAEEAVERLAQLERRGECVAGRPKRARLEDPALARLDRAGMLRPVQEILPLPEMLPTHRGAAAAGGIGEVQTEGMGDQVQGRCTARRLESVVW